MTVALVGVTVCAKDIETCLRSRRTEFMDRREYHSLWYRGDDRSGYHAKMAAKYDWAFRHPWLPVWPDTPEPE